MNINFKDTRYYLLCDLIRKCYHLSRLPLKSLSYKFHLSGDQLTYLNSKEHTLNSTKRITVTIKFYDYISFRSPKRIHCLNPMRYHGAYIENTCCHQPPSTVT